MSTAKNETVAEILRRAVSVKPVPVPVAKVTIDPKKNVREPDISTWDIEAMADDLAAEGQLEPVILEHIKGEYFPLRGFRRTSAVRLNAEKKVIDPTTGKIFENVLAFVIDGPLSEADRVSILIDGGNTRLLNAAECFYAVEMLDNVAQTDAQLTLRLRGLLDQHYPLKRAVKDDKDYVNHRRGVMQNLLAAARGPVLMRDAFVLKLKRLQAWPLITELGALKKTYDEEKAADTSRKINRANPGPLWLAEWKKFTDAKKAEAANGGRKAPPVVGAFNRDAMKKVEDTSDSRLLKVVMAALQRNLNNPEEALKKLDVLCVKIEKGEAKPKEIEHLLDTLTAKTEEVLTGPNVGKKTVAA